jgi:hypothetical protein
VLLWGKTSTKASQCKRKTIDNDVPDPEVLDITSEK